MYLELPLLHFSNSFSFPLFTSDFTVSLSHQLHNFVIAHWLQRGLQVISDPALRSATSAHSLMLATDKIAFLFIGHTQFLPCDGVSILSQTSMQVPKSPVAAPLFQPKKQRKVRVVKKWTTEEDNVMLSLVAEHGIKSWGVVASHLGGRSGKQCRERYHNQLDPTINKSAWTESEEQLLMRLHRQFGNRWAEISKHIEGR